MRLSVNMDYTVPRGPLETHIGLERVLWGAQRPRPSSQRAVLFGMWGGVVGLSATFGLEPVGV